MPSVTDIQSQQQSTSSTTHGKSTPPPTQQTTSTDTTNADPLAQAILALEKKQRNLGKRKEKLEGHQELAKKGTELNKDQKDALAKYPDVLGQIECIRELNEQFKKIQIESSKNQKRLLKQAAEEKRQLVSQSLRQYAQIRYLLEHRPTSIKSEESSLLDELSAVIIPSDNSSDSISRSVDTVLSIYQNGPSSTIKTLTGKNPQEIRQILEELIQNFDTQQITSSAPPPPPSASEQEPIQELEQTNEIQSSNKNLNDYPLKFDTRNQNISLEQIIQDNMFFPTDLNNQTPEDNREQSPDPNQYLPTITVINSNINDQPSSPIENQQQDEQQQQPPPNGKGQHRRGNGSGNRGGQFNNGNGIRNYNRRGSNYYYQQQRGGSGGGQYDNSYGGGGQYGNFYGGDGQYDNSYGGGQRQYNEYNRGRGGHRGYRGGGYRGYNNNNGNGYQKSAQYQQVHPAPSSQLQ